MQNSRLFIYSTGNTTIAIIFLTCQKILAGPLKKYQWTEYAKLSNDSLFQKKINLSNFFHKKREVREVKSHGPCTGLKTGSRQAASGSQQIITDIVNDTIILIAPDIAQHRGLLTPADIILWSLLRQ